jgi:uncharacterized membrane protein YkvA (DUF1232 family)
MEAVAAIKEHLFFVLLYTSLPFKQVYSHRRKAWRCHNFLFDFLMDEIQSRYKKMKCWACKAVAAAASFFII